MRTTTTSLMIGLATFALYSAAAAADKTLVSWVTLANTTQQGGGALTILCGRQFDGIVCGEKTAGRWMGGSETFVRTQGDQQTNVVENADSKTQLQMAASTDNSNEQAMFFRNEKEVFIISYAIAVHEPGYPSYCLPLNVAHVDKEGTLRATYWKGNDAMKEHPVPVKFVAMDLQPVLHQRLDHLPVTQGTGQRRQDQPQPMRPDKFI